MIVVLDTNVLLVSIPRKSKYNWLFQKLINNEFDIAISNEIILEYSEKITEFFTYPVADSTIKLLLNLPNCLLVTTYFKWNLINTDFSDNKFVDCAIASNSDYIVTNDKHFNILREIDFPAVDIISLEQFEKMLT